MNSRFFVLIWMRSVASQPSSTTIWCSFKMIVETTTTMTSQTERGSAQCDVRRNPLPSMWPRQDGPWNFRDHNLREYLSKARKTHCSFIWFLSIKGQCHLYSRQQPGWGYGQIKSSLSEAKTSVSKQFRTFWLFLRIPGSWEPVYFGTDGQYYGTEGQYFGINCSQIPDLF